MTCMVWMASMAPNPPSSPTHNLPPNQTKPNHLNQPTPTTSPFPTNPRHRLPLRHSDVRGGGADDGGGARAVHLRGHWGRPVQRHQLHRLPRAVHQRPRDQGCVRGEKLGCLGGCLGAWLFVCNLSGWMWMMCVCMCVCVCSPRLCALPPSPTPHLPNPPNPPNPRHHHDRRDRRVRGGGGGGVAAGARGQEQARRLLHRRRHGPAGAAHGCVFFVFFSFCFWGGGCRRCFVCIYVYGWLDVYG